jgi:peptidoglycan DL-endopeptidase LytE
VIVPGGRIEEAPRTALSARSFARPRDEVGATRAPDPRPSLAPAAVAPTPSTQPERPAWVPFPARFSAPKPLTPLTYTVADGDTLTSIAARFGVSPESIALSSGIRDNADSLSIDQKLVIPPVPGVVHVVQPGDTLDAVAERYSAPAETIARANELHDPFVLQIGEMLVVPGGKVPAAGGDAAASGPSAAPTSGGWSIVGVAAKYLGYPYVWGGSSPAYGFDCSGFVYYVYRAAGMPIPRDMWGQLQSGTRVSYGNLQPGDIVFFVDTYQPGLSHDGIYLGGGRFIQAETEGVGVVVTSLSNPYWAARYYGATRPW